MPMPTPEGDESESDFVSRFMKDMAGEFPDEKQRAAVAYKRWRENMANASFGKERRHSMAQAGQERYGKK